MAEPTATEFVEDRVPLAGIEESISELVEIYGGEMTSSRPAARAFTLPLRRGVPTSGAIECTISWTTDHPDDATVTLTCDRDVDAPKFQRVMMLVAGVVGSLLFLMWPFFPQRRELGTLAWVGGAIALAVYFLSLRRTSGGIAYDFLQRVARRQRNSVAE